MSIFEKIFKFFEDGRAAIDYGQRISKWCQIDPDQACFEIHLFVNSSSSKQINQMEESFKSVIEIEQRSGRRQLVVFYFDKFKEFVARSRASH